MIYNVLFTLFFCVLGSSLSAAVARTPSLVLQIEDFDRTLTQLEHELLAANVRAGFNAWAAFIDSPSQVVAKVKIVKTKYGRVDCASATNIPAKTKDGITVVEESTAYKLRTGLAVIEGQADMVMQIDPGFLREEIWLDPEPHRRLGRVPKNRTDGVTIFSHEVGHAIGSQSFRNLQSGELGDNFMTSFDRYISVEPERFIYSGPNVLKIFGAPIELTSGSESQNIRHLGSEFLKNDLMNGHAFKRGTRYMVSRMNVAILGDLGIPLKPGPR